MKLHLGCGTRILPGFINVDLRFEPNPIVDPEKLTCQPDVIDNIATLEKFNNNTVELIYNCHVLEHFKKNERLGVLKRWFDLLKPGGILRTAVPDFEAVATGYIKKIVPLKVLWSSLSGSQRHDWDYHFHCYDFENIKEDLESIGFINVRRYDWRNIENFKDDYSRAYYPHMDFEKGFHLSLNVECTKPNEPK